MTIRTFKSSSDFGNERFLVIGMDGFNRLDGVEENLSGVGLHLGIGFQSLNTLLEEQAESKDGGIYNIDRFCKDLVRANGVSANRTEQNRTE